MADDPRVICPSASLAEGGPGVRFTVAAGTEKLPAFALRHGGRVYAYLNRCAHIGVELDWVEGEFRDESGLYLICALHGATYSIESGQCLSGPCRGASLQRVEVEEKAAIVYLKG